MLYEMCVAYKPTKLANYRYGKFNFVVLINFVGAGPIPFRDRDWRKHDKRIKSFIMECLEIDPLKRITALDAR